MLHRDYDVIIIGGRCAGSTLAIRLARQQLKVLVIDRATFPSQPAVTSSPVFHNGHMRLLDELDIPEAEYSLPGSRVDQYIIDFVDHFNVIIPCSLMNLERSYVRGVNRAPFDEMLWKHMESYSDYITARQGFSMVDILKDESGNVIGIVGKSRTGLNENITADLVVGADGRFSIAAKKFGAKVIEERNEFTSGGFEAQWENVAPYAEGVSTEFCIYSSAKCYLDLFIPISQGHYYVVAYMRSQDVNRGDKSPQEYYIESLKRIPKAWQRLEGARQIGKLEAICPVENGYREPFGRGWALTGDAYHYKDPVDGQGIYDALLETKILAEAIAEWKGGTLTWEQAGALYKEKAWAATYPMFQSSVARVRRELHTTPPSFILNTLIKWMLNDPAYQTAFLRTLARASDPLKMPTMPTPGMIWRGILRSFQPSDKSKAKSALKVPQPQ